MDKAIIKEPIDLSRYDGSRKEKRIFAFGRNFPLQSFTRCPQKQNGRQFLAMNPNIVFSKEQLFEKIWGYDYVGDSATVMVHINRIREKIEDDSRKPEILETVWGAGYRFNK